MELQKTSIDSIKEISLTDEFRLQESSRHSYELLSHALAILNALAVYGEHFLLWRPTAFSLPDGVNASLIPSLPGTPGHRHQKLVFATSGDNPSPPDWIDAQTRRHLLNNPTYDVVVEQDGSGKLRTIQEAVDAYNENSIRRVIYIRAGVYKQQVTAQDGEVLDIYWRWHKHSHHGEQECGARTGHDHR